jgi:creatinine amidohydrolase
MRQGYSIFRETLVDMSWPEVKKAAEANALVIVPVGAIEEHGPHMSLGADVYLTYHGCKLLRRKLEEQQIRAVIAPPLYWGVFQADETGGYPGSFGVQPSTMKALLLDVLADTRRAGFRHVYVANLHGDRQHRQTIDAALAEARQTLGLDVYDEKLMGGGRPRLELYRVEKPFRPDFHAGAIETREMLEYFPEEVNTEIARTLQPQGTFHPLGYVGDPANHGRATGQMLAGLVNAEAEKIAKWLRTGANP